MEFHAPHALHRPDHFGLSLPHSVQKKTVFAFILSLFRTVLQQPGQNGRGQPPLVLLGLQVRGSLSFERNPHSTSTPGHRICFIR